MKLLISVLIIALIIYLFIYPTEPFYASSCEALKTGLVCSIPNSPLFMNKCYGVTQTPEHPEGTWEHINVEDCEYYPKCEDIGKECNAPLIAKLSDGYVERL
jgi:hypothetical protein